MERLIDREKVIRGLECCIKSTWEDPFAECEHCPYNEISIAVQECRAVLSADALDLLKEQEAEIRQLRLALDIAKGTCKGIKSGGGQFADMPTM